MSPAPLIMSGAFTCIILLVAIYLLSEAPIVTLEPCKKPLSVGDRVECKHTQSDPLYYAGVVTAFWDGTDRVCLNWI